MATTSLRFSKEELARRGEALYERDIRPLIEGGNDSNFVLIDVASGDYEIDASEMAAASRLSERRPNAQVWMRRVGSRHSCRFGRGRGSAAT